MKDKLLKVLIWMAALMFFGMVCAMLAGIGFFSGAYFFGS